MDISMTCKHKILHGHLFAKNIYITTSDSGYLPIPQKRPVLNSVAKLSKSTIVMHQNSSTLYGSTKESQTQQVVCARITSKHGGLIQLKGVL